MAISLFASRLVPGFLVAQRYRLTRQLGEGAMGAVWAAVDEVTTREVALKLLLRPDPEHKQRLSREARACGALKHKNIIDVFDIMETETGEPFLVMQLLSGETVAEVLARKRRLEPEEAAAIGRDVARACSAAHAIQIIHRDLKPANIFLHHEPDIDGYIVKVLDFGIAKNLGASDGLHTVAGGAVGSPFYMSPEQVRGDPTIDHRADIWALGVVLFEMITGVRPFQGETPEVFAKILTGEIPTVTRYVRRVDDRLAQIVSRCLAREREHRYAGAAEVAAALEPFTRAQSATATPPPYAPTVPSPQVIPAPKASSPGLAPPIGMAPPMVVPPPRPSQGGAILGGADDLDEDDAPTAFYKPEEVARASAPGQPHLPATARRTETYPQPAAPPTATPLPAPPSAPADPDWSRGGTVKMAPEDAARYRLPQGSAPSLTGPPPAPPPPPGVAPHGPAAFQSQPGFPPVGDAYATPPGYVPPPGAAGWGPTDDGYPPPPPPTAILPGPAPSSSVTPLMASGAGALIPDDENPFASRKLPRSVVALLAGLVVALGIITVSLVVVLSGPDEQPAATTPEGASAAPAVSPPGTTAAPAPMPAPAPTPAPSTTTTTTTTATAPPKPTAASTPAPAPTPKPTPKPTATSTSTARPKRDCSKLKLLERQRCERGG